MKRNLRWAGIAIGSILALVIILALVLMLIGGSRFNRTYDIPVATVLVPTDPASIERGKHFVEAIAICQVCHGDNLAGDTLSDDPVFARIVASNLTSGRGGIGGTYSDIDYVRAIRHGVGNDGKGLPLMPSEAFNKFSDHDLGAIIAYLKSLPPVDNEVPESKAGPIGRIFALLDPSLFSVQLIDHAAPRAPAPSPGVTEEYGAYLATGCTVCHGQNLGGARVFIVEGSPNSANLTSGGALGSWSESDFINTLRTGVTPEGKFLNPNFMPWHRFRLMTDDEMKAIWLYLHALPPLAP